MSAHSVGRVVARSADRRWLRATVALGTAALVGIVGIPVVHAAPGAAPVAVLAAQEADDPAADIAAVERLKASYFANVDAKDWTALRTLFAPGAVVDTRASLGPIFYDREAFIAFTRSVLGPLSTRHQGYDPQITFTSPTAASVEWTMQDHLIFRDTVGVHGYGHYSDRYEKIGDTWVIEYSRLTRTGITVVFPGLDHFVSEFGRRLSTRGPVAALAYAVYALAHIAAPYTNPTPPVPPGNTAAAAESSRVTNTRVAAAGAPTESVALSATAVKASPRSGPQSTASGKQTDRVQAVGPSSRDADVPSGLASSGYLDGETGTVRDADTEDGSEITGSEVTFDDGSADAALDAEVGMARTASTHGAPPPSMKADADASTERATASATDATPKTAAEPKAED